VADSYTIHNSTGAGGHATFIPEIWANEAIGVLHKAAIMPQLVQRNWEKMIAKQGDTINIPKTGTLTVKDKAIDTVIVPDQPQGSVVQITLSKHKVVSFLVEDVAQAQSSPDIILSYVRDGMKKIAKQVDLDLLGMYASLANSVGTGGDGMCDSSFLDSLPILNAKNKLDTNEADDEGRSLVIHPDAEVELLRCAKFTSAERIGNANAVIQGMIGKIYGFNVFTDPRVIQTTAGTPSVTSTHNMAFIRDAMALVTRPLPLPAAGQGVQAAYAAVDGIGIRITYGWSQQYLGTLVTMDMLYGFGVVQDELATELLS